LEFSVIGRRPAEVFREDKGERNGDRERSPGHHDGIQGPGQRHADSPCHDEHPRDDKMWPQQSSPSRLPAVFAGDGVVRTSDEHVVQREEEVRPLRELEHARFPVPPNFARPIQVKPLPIKATQVRAP